MKKKTELTQLERIVIDHIVIYPNEITWTDIYLAAYPQTKASTANLPVNVSRYKNSELVQTYYKQAQTKFEELKRNVIQERTIIDENGKNVVLTDEQVNFTNIQEFISYLNTKANNLTDEKERQKYLQMLSDLLRFKDQDTKDNDIIRFYMPLKCLECPFKKEKND